MNLAPEAVRNNLNVAELDYMSKLSQGQGGIVATTFYSPVPGQCTDVRFREAWTPEGPKEFESSITASNGNPGAT